MKSYLGSKNQGRFHNILPPLTSASSKILSLSFHTFTYVNSTYNTCLIPFTYTSLQQQKSTLRSFIPQHSRWGWPTLWVFYSSPLRMRLAQQNSYTFKNKNFHPRCLLILHLVVIVFRFIVLLVVIYCSPILVHLMLFLLLNSFIVWKPLCCESSLV